MKFHKSFEKFIDTSLNLNKMKSFVDATSNICPSKENVFRCFENDLSKLKCIILGMDPYTATYEYNGKVLPVATGRSFEVANIDLWTDKYKQVSLLNIFKTLCYLKFGNIYSADELRKKVNIDNFRFLNTHDWFDAMEQQGVMFLNATLTSEVGKSNVHKNVWKDFMDEFLRYILSVKNDVKWLIWGDLAMKRVEGIVDNSNVVYTCHPAARFNNTFVKDCCFKNIIDIEWV